MITYEDGQPVHVGDFVDLDGMPATVIVIVESQEEIVATGLQEPCVGFMTERLGKIFQAPSDSGWDGIILVSRNG